MQDGMATPENSLKAAYRVSWPKNPPIWNENIHVWDQEGDSVAKALVAGVRAGVWLSRIHFDAEWMW